MFASSTYSSVMADPGRKRLRDHETDASVSGLGEHRNKRIHCLPLRSSPRSTEEHDAWSQDVHQENPELDMMDSSFHADEDLMLHDQANGRMPTPMQPTFAAQIRGQHCEWAGPGPALSNLNGVVNLGHHSSGFSNDQYVPRAVSSAADWNALQNNRRLPSPITEDDLSPEQAIGSLAMMLDESNTMAMISPEIVALAGPHRTMDHPNAMMDVESSPTHHMDVERESPSPGSVKKGHVRSKHTIDSWTWQPGMKKSFSIGYRADCEKCRLKVPGHFNHIVIS